MIQGPFGQKKKDLIKFIDWKLKWMKIGPAAFIIRIKEQYADLVISLMNWKKSKRARTQPELQICENYNKIFRVYVSKELVVLPKRVHYDHLLKQIEHANDSYLRDKFTRSFFQHVENDTYPLNATSTRFFEFLQTHISNHHRNTEPANSWIWQQ